MVGCDARHRSDEFADEVARVLAGAGVRVHLLPRPGPTPLLAFAVRHLGAGAGVMITASHNPAADNGYKLYLGDGAQVIPPVDAEIEGRIARLGPLSAIATAGLDDPLIVRHGDEVASAYLDAVAGQALGRTAARDLTVVYTPMHGVASDLMLRAIRRAGFAAPRVVAAQAKPDPDFPTVAFPNPEEPGALDLALADARAIGADLVLASDPDGDRLAVAVPGRARRRHRRRLAAADRRPGGRAARRVPARREGHRGAAGRDHDRLLDAAVEDRRERGRALQGDANGVQVDRQGRDGDGANRRPGSSSATRRRSATRSGRSSATRTASARRSPPFASRLKPKPAAAPSAWSTTTWS